IPGYEPHHVAGGAEKKTGDKAEKKSADKDAAKDTGADAGEHQH
ncbi:copper oxidase, partial [Streptomyces sp. SID7982]|nr:copper oxidase [Streptomyces sp. SID7982]